jgi:hypothetical protein
MRPGVKRGRGRKRKVRSAIPLAPDGSTWGVLSEGKPSSILRGPLNNTYDLTQEISYGTAINTSTTTPSFGSIAFILNSFDQAGSLAALFDQYRIAMIEIWLTPQFTAGNTSTNYASVIDYDDSALLTTYQQALDYQNVVDTQLSVGQYRRFIPHVAVATYSGAFTSFMNVTAPWIDCSSPSVLHYGLKLAAPASTVSGNVQAVARVHMSFRQVR